MSDDYSKAVIFALVPHNESIETARGYVYINYVKSDLHKRVCEYKNGYRRKPLESHCKMLFDKYHPDREVKVVILDEGPFPTRTKLMEKTIEYQQFYPCINKYYYWKMESESKGFPFMDL